MSLCIMCGGSNPDQGEICSYHMAAEESWSVGNRIMCDFVHRAIVPPRLEAADRDPILEEEEVTAIA
jgi:hypothetical protein